MISSSNSNDNNSDNNSNNNNERRDLCVVGNSHLYSFVSLGTRQPMQLRNRIKKCVYTEHMIGRTKYASCL